MSRAVCLLLHLSSAPSWLPKNAFPYLLAVVSCCLLMASSSVVCGASCGAACVVLGSPGAVVAIQLAPSSPVPAPGPPGDWVGDWPFFKPTVVRRFFKDVPNEITTFSIPRRLVLGDFGHILWSFCRLMSEYSIFRLVGVQLSVWGVSTAYRKGLFSCLGLLEGPSLAPLPFPRDVFLHRLGCTHRQLGMVLIFEGLLLARWG